MWSVQQILRVLSSTLFQIYVTLGVNCVFQSSNKIKAVNTDDDNHKYKKVYCAGALNEFCIGKYFINENSSKDLRQHVYS